MKRIKLILVGVISLMFVGIVEAQSNTLDYLGKVDVLTSTVNDIVSYKDGYIIVGQENETVLYSYNTLDQLVATKVIEGLKSSKIIKYNENYLVVGVLGNTLKVFMIDSHLKIVDQKETSYFIQSSNDINLYSYNGKVYVMLTYEEMLINSNVYEIDGDLNIIEKKFSSFNSDELIHILKSDYYLIHMNDKNEDVHYNKSVYIENINVLVGNVISEDNQSKGIITLLDNKGEELFESLSDTYTEFKNVTIVNDKIIVLAKGMDVKNYLVIFNVTGEVLEEILIESDCDIVKLFKGASKVRLIQESNDVDTEILTYGYEVGIFKEEEIFGSVIVPSEVVPYDIVEVQVLPNSGYEVEKIVVKDRFGREIEIIDGKFVMPEDDVFISVSYVATIINPDTEDIIMIALFLLVVLIPVSVFLYRKMAWLK